MQCNEFRLSMERGRHNTWFLCRAFQQMKRLGGFGDLLEDDLEDLPQMLNATSDRASCIKNKQQQAFLTRLYQS